jgi:fructose-bisphosphate aldolase class I
MTAREVLATARALVAGDRGLLAMDESNPTCDKRFARAGIAQRVWSDQVATGS